MTTPLISVLLPCRDCADSVGAALDSLLAQTLDDFEILAVDDGSRDATPAVLAKYARRDPRVRVLARPRQGLVAALSAGLTEARAPFIARMDADDLCLPKRLELQAVRLDVRPDLGLVACRVRFGGDRERAGGYAAHVDWTNSLLSAEDIALNRFVESPLAHPSVLFRAETARRFGGYRDGPFPEDYELWLRWLAAGVGMEKLEEELVVWNDPPGRLSRSDSRYSAEAFYRVKAGYLAGWLQAHNPLWPEVAVIGAGRPTRKRAELLCEHGARITAYVDIDPRKVGKSVHGRPVLHREDLPGPGRFFFLSYVASRGAREDITAFLLARGHVLGRDFLLAA